MKSDPAENRLTDTARAAHELGETGADEPDLDSESLDIALGRGEDEAGAGRAGALELLPPGAIVNVHRRDGFATGGYEYAGLGVAAPIEQREPVVMLSPIDEQEAVEVPLGEVAWIDVLGAPTDFGRA